MPCDLVARSHAFRSCDGAACLSRRSERQIEELPGSAFTTPSIEERRSALVDSQRAPICRFTPVPQSEHRSPSRLAKEPRDSPTTADDSLESSAFALRLTAASFGQGGRAAPSSGTFG